ncbi:MAG: hypothetical protein IPJ34_38355 [Myxococcales bacterium]|nr:hypothetical protein [Myxococcales bacterium]
MASRVRSTMQLVWTFLFALPFLGAGVVMAYTGLRLVLGGQGTGVMALVFGLVFGGAGLRTLVQTFSEFRSAEALAAKGTRPSSAPGPSLLRMSTTAWPATIAPRARRTPRSSPTPRERWRCCRRAADRPSPGPSG